MTNFLPKRDEQLDGSRPRAATGIVITAWNADRYPWHTDLDADTMHGSERNRPVTVRNEQGVPQVAPSGFSIPCAVPAVELNSGGVMDGRVQVALRKYRTRDGAASDITPTWPRVEGISTSTNTAVQGVGKPSIPINLYGAGASSSQNTKMAFLFTFTVSAEDATNKFLISNLRFLARFIKSGSGDVSGFFKVDIYNVTTSNPTTAVTANAQSEVNVNVSSIREFTSSDAASVFDEALDLVNVRLFKPVEIAANTTYAIVISDLTTNVSVGYVQFAHGYSRWDSIGRELGDYKPPEDTYAYEPVGTGPYVVTQQVRTRTTLTDDRFLYDLYASGKQFFSLSGPVGWKKVEKFVGAATNPYQTYINSSPGFTLRVYTVSQTDGEDKVATQKYTLQVDQPTGQTGVVDDDRAFLVMQNAASPYDGNLLYYSRKDTTARIYRGQPSTTKATAVVVATDMETPVAFKRHLTIWNWQAIVSKNKLYYTINGGVDWTAVTMAGYAGGDIVSLYISSGGSSGSPDTFGLYVGDANGELYVWVRFRSPSDSAIGTWTKVTGTGVPAASSTNQMVTVLESTDLSRLIVGTSSGNLYHVAAGPVWTTKAHAGLPASEAISQVFGLAQSGYLVFYVQVNGDFYKTYDGGGQFFKIENLDDFSPGDKIVDADSRFGYVSSDSATDNPLDDRYHFVLKGGNGNFRFGRVSYWLGVIRPTDVGRIYANSAWGTSLAAPFFAWEASRSQVKARDSRVAPFYATLSDNKLKVTNLNLVGDDSRFEDFDKVQVLLGSDVFQGGFRVAATVDTGTPEVEINQVLDDFVGEEEVVPFTNWPFGGHKGMIRANFGGNSNLIAFGQHGFSSYRDSDFAVGCERHALQSMTRGTIGQSTVWAIGSYSSSWTDGVQNGTQALREALDGMVCEIYEQKDRAFYATRTDGSTTKTVPLEGTLIGQGRLRHSVYHGIMLLEEAVGELVPFSSQLPANAEPGQSIFRMEVRRPIFARVQTGSDVVKLLTRESEATALSPCNIGNEWMLHHTLRVIGIEGQALVIRVEPLGEPRIDSPYPTQQYFPSDTLRLEEAWSGSSGTGLLELLPDNRSLWFGQSAVNGREMTAAKLRLRTGTGSPIVALGLCKGVPVAVCAKDEVLVIQSNGLAEPGTLVDWAGYDISQVVDVQSQKAQHSCVSPRVANDFWGNLYWIGEGSRVYRFDLSSVEAVSAEVAEDELSQWVQGMNSQLSLVGMSGGGSEPSIHVLGGYTSKHYYATSGRNEALYVDAGTGGESQGTVRWNDIRPRRNRRMVYLPKGGNWLNAPEFGDADTAASLLTTDGSSRLAVLSKGRISLYGKRSVRGSTETIPFSIQTSGQGTSTEVGSWGLGDNDQSIWGLAAATVNVPTILFPLSNPAFAQLAGIKAWKVQDDGQWEPTELLCAGSAPQTTTTLFNSRALVSFTGSGSSSYFVMWGARPFKIKLPTLRARPPRLGVTLERIQFVIEKWSASSGMPDFPMLVTIEGSQGIGTQDAGKVTVTRRFVYGSTMTGTNVDQELRFDELIEMDGSPHAEVTVTIEGLAPTDQNIAIGPVKLTWREQG